MPSSALSTTSSASILAVRQHRSLLVPSLISVLVGIGFSTPPLTLFESAPEALNLLSTFPISLNESVSSFGRAYALGQIYSELATERVKLVAESVSTPAVATDMLNIARAFGYDKVNYWGVS